MVNINRQRILTTLLMLVVITLALSYVEADVYMYDETGREEVIENDDFEHDVILMPNMNGMLMNDDMIM